MRQILLATTGLLALAVTAHAADLAVKAPVASGYPYAASGFYFGVGVSSTAGSASVAGTGLFAAGAGVDGVVGYQWQGGLEFIAPEVDFTYTSVGNSAACPVIGGVTSCSTHNSWEIEPLIKFGFPITTITSLLPNLSSVFPALPQFPAGATLTGTQHPYIYVGAPIRDVSASYGLNTGQEWLVQPEVGAGILSQWQQGLVLDTRAGCSIGQNGFNFGTAPLVAPGSTTVGTNCTARLEVLY